MTQAAEFRIKYGLNREPARLSGLRFVTGPLHCENHSTGSQAFQSHIYADMKALNKEACEQFNSVLRSVQHSVTYMKFENDLTAIKVFISFRNMHGLKINRGMNFVIYYCQFLFSNNAKSFYFKKYNPHGRNIFKGISIKQVREPSSTI